MEYKVRLERSGHNRIKIHTNSREYIKEIRKDFSHKAKNYFWTPSFQAGQWNGEISYITGTNTFPFGLLTEFIRLHKTKYKKVSLKIDEQVKEFYKGVDFPIKYDLNLFPRPYQKESIEAVLKYSKGIIRSATASGKSLVISYIIKNLLDNRSITGVKRSLVVVPSIQLIRQFKNDMIEYGLNGDFIGQVDKDHKEWDNAIVISTWQSLKNNHDKLSMFECMIGDECLTPDTEILTENGWKFINTLEKNEKVAQWDEKENIRFVTPFDYIEKEVNEDLVHITGRHTDILSTVKHEQPYKTKYNNGNEFNRRRNMEDIKLGHSIYIPIAGYNHGKGELTSLMRFMIMTQADGNITPQTNKDYTIVHFKFSKKRKIDRFLYIMSINELKWKELKPQGKVRRFNVQAPKNISKDLWCLTDIKKVNSDFVDSFIEELIKWDGSKKDNKLYYSTTNSNNADFIQAICSLGGWSCSRTIQHDNRKSEYNDIHRMWLFKKTWRNTQQLKRSLVPYKGKVYCVSVPYSNIIIRRNNKVMITGNCHGVKAQKLKKIFSKSNAIYKLGFTGTLPTHIVELWNTKAYLGPVLKDYPSGLLADQGYISKCNVKLISLSYPMGIESNYYKEIKEEVFHNRDRLKLIGDLVEQLDHNVLLLVSYLDEGYKLEKMLNNTTNRMAIFLSGKDKAETREDWRQKMMEERHRSIALVATYGIFQQGINIPNLKYLILASPSKSKIRVLQSVGRTLRKHDDKKDGSYIFDIIDEVKFLKKHGGKRMEYYKNEGFEIEELPIMLGDNYETSLAKFIAACLA